MADYGLCKTCGITLATEQDARAHMDQTLGTVPIPPDEPWVQARGHTVTSVAVSRSTAERTVDDALECAMEHLDQAVYDGRCTADEVRKALVAPTDLVELWDAWSDES